MSVEATRCVSLINGFLILHLHKMKGKTTINKADYDTYLLVDQLKIIAQ